MNPVDFYISTDIESMDVDFVHNYLSNTSYWAKGRSREHVLKSMENSICFGLFTDSGKQIGFARLVTDYVVFAWIMDLFIDASYKGRGLGKKLVNHIVELPYLQHVNGIGLRTEDAHGLYEKFGFQKIADAENWMLRKKRTA